MQMQDDGKMIAFETDNGENDFVFFAPKNKSSLANTASMHDKSNGVNCVIKSNKCNA